MFLRWQHRTPARLTTRQRPVSLTSGAQEPAAGDLALEAEARAVTRELSRRPRWTNTRFWRSNGSRTSWVAVIVESRRVDGRPRQHLIRYVGSIDCADVQWLSARQRFWDRADIVLVQFDQERRERFEQTLEPSTALAPLTRIDTGNDSREASGQPDAATGTSWTR